MALVLKRKKGESVRVDGPAEIVFDYLSEHQVQIRVVAPGTTKILRGELVPHEEQTQEQPDRSAKDIALPSDQAG